MFYSCHQGAYFALFVDWMLALGRISWMYFVDFVDLRSPFFVKCIHQKGSTHIYLCGILFPFLINFLLKKINK